MQKHELEGTIRIVNDTETYPSGFQKKTVIIDTEEQYPQPIAVEFLKDKIDLMNGFNAGDKAKMHVNIRGKSHCPPGGEERFYNTIVCWKIERL